MARPGFSSNFRSGATPGVRTPYGMRVAPRGFAPGVSSARPSFYSRNGFAARPGGTHIPYTGGYPYGGGYYYYGGGYYSAGYGYYTAAYAQT